MVLLNDKPTRLAIIVGKYLLSGNCTDVIGGTMTAGTADAYGSNLITWAPPFISAPIILVNAISAGATTATIMPISITGVTVSNAYLQCYASGGGTNLLLIGEAKL